MRQPWTVGQAAAVAGSALTGWADGEPVTVVETGTSFGVPVVRWVGTRWRGTQNERIERSEWHGVEDIRRA